MRFSPSREKKQHFEIPILSMLPLIYDCREGVGVKIHSPRQLLPSPEYPGLQEQLYDPLVLIYSASALQSLVALAHSSIYSKSKDSTVNENAKRL